MNDNIYDFLVSCNRFLSWESPTILLPKLQTRITKKYYAALSSSYIILPWQLWSEYHYGFAWVVTLKCDKMEFSGDSDMVILSCNIKTKNTQEFS